MDGYRILIKPSAVKELEDIPGVTVSVSLDGFKSSWGDPRPHGSEKLSAEEKYKVRQGEYRVIYAVYDDEARTVLAVKIAHRREVYR